jgi:hypothetical protein
MAGRNRNRPALMKEEADEERQLWSEVKNSGNRIDQLVVCAVRLLQYLIGMHHIPKSRPKLYQAHTNSAS